MPSRCPSRTFTRMTRSQVLQYIKQAWWMLVPLLILSLTDAQTSVTSDWTQDAPGARHKITIDDLPAPYATKSAQNDPRVVRRPPGAQLRVPPGFKIEEYASG